MRRGNDVMKCGNDVMRREWVERKGVGAQRSLCVGRGGWLGSGVLFYKC